MADFEIQVRDHGAVRELTFSRAARLNALSDGLLRALKEALLRAEREGARAILLRGEGPRAFSAGYDLNALASPEPSGPLLDSVLEDALNTLDAISIPTVALVNGHAFGGGLELAARCDLRIGVSGAKLGMPPAKLGVIYAARGLARFFALLGPARTRELFLLGEPWTADRAHALGLLNEVHPTLEAAEERARQLAETLAANSPLSISGTRKILVQLERALLAGIDREEIERLRRAAFASEDAREGRTAFLEKRAPKFTGK